MSDLLKYLIDREGSTMDQSEARMLPPLVLAYVGDAVYDMFVRTYLVLTQRGSAHRLHRKAIGWVNASSQSRALHQVKDILTEEELTMVKRGRNSKSNTVPKNADVVEYRWATGLETLLGYLYLSGNDKRIYEIMGLILAGSDNRD